MNHAPSFRAGKARIAVIPFAPAHRGGRSHCGASALRAHEPMPDEVLLDHLATPPSSRLLVDQVEANALVKPSRRIEAGKGPKLDPIESADRKSTRLNSSH